ncbi:hypothetical protein [Serratia quinivorans]|uniref:hypothetical protein n=1 Tax=Serratia quinivorans TaxID=137545 RepID=UPI0021BD67E3|nr:hypothetical protein [Serratia quinivorans]
MYLDQNTLSDLRQRKVEETDNDDFKLLKFVIMSEQVLLVYSHVTLEEILQIKNIEYRQEHVELLMELNAQYIEPLTGELNNKSPSDIWKEYLENNKINSDLGIDTLISVSQLTSRKFSGLPVGESFNEINDKLKESLNTVITNGEIQLASIDISLLGDEQRCHFIDMKRKIYELREGVNGLEALVISDEQQLGPQPFRDMPEIKSLGIQGVDINHVVNKIEEIFEQENSSFDFEHYFEKTAQSDVARAYSLMNWAGYYADDFTKSKKGKDRFNASNKDMMHVIAALGADFLISNDIKFCKKAMACFAYVGFGTVVCSPKDFIKKYCKFK